jgi:predicted phage tail protein
MKRDDLKKLDLSDEAIDKIMAMNGADIEKHKETAATAKAEVEAIKGQLTEANTQIESFKGMNIDQIKASADEWKTKAEQAQADATAQVAKIRFDIALEKELKEWKVKDPSDVIPHLKADMLKLGEDGKFIGLKEQIEPLKTSKDYLFTDATEPPKIVTGGQSQSVIGDNIITAARAAAGLVTK